MEKMKMYYTIRAYYENGNYRNFSRKYESKQSAIDGAESAAYTNWDICRICVEENKPCEKLVRGLYIKTIVSDVWSMNCYELENLRGYSKVAP
jgi:hypothetical protein